MDNFKIKGLFILAIMVVALVFALPTFVRQLPEGWIGPKSKIRLGLDLRGGMHLVLKVEADKAEQGKLGRMASDLKMQMMQKRIHYVSVSPLPPDSIEVKLRSTDEKENLLKMLETEYPFLKELNAESQGGILNMVLKMDPAEASRIKEAAISQALETIRNRIDQFGVTEPVIIPQGKDRILVQLPGVTDPQRAISLIGKTAQLEFKLVDEENSIDGALRGDVPLGSYLAYQKSGDSPILLKEEQLMTGDLLEDARVQIASSYNQPYVSIVYLRGLQLKM